MRRDGKSEMELQIVQQETDDVLSSVFLLSESFFEGGDGDVEDSAFGIGLELVVAVDGEIGACWEVGFVAAACLTAEVVDGGVFFVAADEGIVAADLCGQAGGELPAFLQGLPAGFRAGCPAPPAAARFGRLALLAAALADCPAYLAVTFALPLLQGCFLPFICSKTAALNRLKPP